MVMVVIVVVFMVLVLVLVVVVVVEGIVVGRWSQVHQQRSAFRSLTTDDGNEADNDDRW